MQFYVIVVCTVTSLIIVSNSLSIALLVCIALGLLCLCVFKTSCDWINFPFKLIDPCALPQGVDYCIFSLALSDLLAGLLIGPLSVVSLEFKTWIFGDTLCKTLGFAIFALWAVNVNSLFWLSVDRLLYITDIKYCTYKMRTRAR